MAKDYKQVLKELEAYGYQKRKNTNTHNHIRAVFIRNTDFFQEGDVVDVLSTKFMANHSEHLIRVLIGQYIYNSNFVLVEQDNKMSPTITNIETSDTADLKIKDSIKDTLFKIYDNNVENA